MSETVEPDHTEPEDHYTFFKIIKNAEIITISTRQKEFILSIRAIEPTTKAHALQITVAEMLPPAHLVSDEIKELPRVWVELSKYLDTNGA